MDSILYKKSKELSDFGRSGILSESLDFRWTFCWKAFKFLSMI